MYPTTHNKRRNKSGVSILLYILFLWFLLPGFIRSLSDTVDRISMLVRGVAGLTSLILFLSMRASKTLRSLLFYIVYLAVLTSLIAYSPANAKRFIAIYADIISVVIISEYLLTRDTFRFMSFLNGLAWAGLIINIGSVILFPNGMVQVANEAGVLAPYYFYDYDNDFIIKYLPSIATIYFYERYVKGKDKGGILTLAAITLCTLSLAITWSVGSLFAFSILFIGFILLSRLPRAVLSCTFFWIVYCIVSAVVIRISLSSEGLTFISAVGKDASFLKRSLMWARAFVDIDRAPIFGIGLLNSTEMKMRFGFATLHNTYANTRLWGGFVGLALQTNIFLSLDADSEACDDYDCKLCGILIGTFLIACVMDCLDLVSNIYILFMIVSNQSVVRCVLEQNNAYDSSAEYEKYGLWKSGRV